MPDISITKEQHSRLEQIRSDLETAFVDTYGHVRTTDAVEYLLDTYSPPSERDSPSADAYERIADAEYPALQQIASDVEAVPGSGIEADAMRGKLLSELGAETLAEKLATVAEEATDGTPDDDTDMGADANPADETSEQSSAQDAGGLLASANRLLDEHDEKWTESDGDTPYEVTLPDGSTKPARTKDDVRQLLFRHY
jgi:hypothetical protein